MMSLMMSLMVSCTLAGSALAQNEDSETPDGEPLREPDVSPTETEQPKLLDLGYYSGDFTERRALTGDWGGSRNDLRDFGITIDVGLTQIYQGNTHGGANTTNAFRYSGSADFYLRFDFEKMKLWDGGRVFLHAETKWGNGTNAKVGSIAPVNFDAVIPGPNNLTTVSQFVFEQDLFDGKVTLAVGKSALGLRFEHNVYASPDLSVHFMNMALKFNPVLVPHAPYTRWEAAVIFRPTEWLQVVTAVTDSRGTAKKIGIDTAFHGPESTSVLQEFTFNIKPFGLPGHQRFGWVWNSAEAIRVRDYDQINLPLPDQLINLSEGRGIGALPDDWAIWYNFDQVVYQEPDDPEQNIGIFGRFGFSTGKGNPIGSFYSIGLGGTGVIPKRDRDTLGIGYYFMKMSNSLAPRLALKSEQGVEAFYDFEITPWMHLSPNLQVIIDPGGGAGNPDVAIVAGMRLQMSF